MSEVLACAVCFARENAGDYGGDPSRLALVGFSYGAAYGSWLALAGDSLEPAWADLAAARGGPPPQAECVANEGSVNVEAFVGIGGRYDFAQKLEHRDAELWNIVDPYEHLGRGRLLPVRLFHGDRDETVPPALSVQMNDALGESGYDTSLTQFDGGHRVPVDLTAGAILELLGE
jgi:predicted esterase